MWHVRGVQAQPDRRQHARIGASATKRWQPRKPRLPPFFSMCKTLWMFQYRPEPFSVDWLKVACTQGVHSEH
ncbi:hypothetical protein TNCV_2250761 [Trichonephila clavipes]|nr:hypothetical protein TNCV_2250761 [Trichonephila clavipes]